MHFPTMRLSVTAISILLMMASLAAPLQAAEAGDWHAFYRGEKFGLSIEYEVQMRSLNYDAAAIAWMRLPRDDVAQTRSKAGAEPLVHIATKQSILGATTTTDCLVDPEPGLAIQRVVRREREDYTSYKATQFGNAGVRLLRLRDDAPLADINWQMAKSSLFPYPEWFTSGADVSDATALFYLLGRKPLLRPGGQMQLPILNNERLLLIELNAAKAVRSASDYKEIFDGAERRVSGLRDALLITIAATHLDPAARREDMKVLGMQGELKMLVDRERHIPLEIEGQVAPVGTVNLQLKRLEI